MLTHVTTGSAHSFLHMLMKGKKEEERIGEEEGKAVEHKPDIANKTTLTTEACDER